MRVAGGRGRPRHRPDFAGLAGARMVGGFTRRLAELCGAGEGAGLARGRGHRGGPARAPGGQDAAPRPSPALAPGRSASVLGARHGRVGGPAGLLLHLQSGRARALRHAGGRLPHGARALLPPAGDARRLHPQEGRPSGA